MKKRHILGEGKLHCLGGVVSISNKSGAIAKLNEAPHGKKGRLVFEENQ